MKSCRSCAFEIKLLQEPGRRLQRLGLLILRLPAPSATRTCLTMRAELQVPWAEGGPSVHSSWEDVSGM